MNRIDIRGVQLLYGLFYFVAISLFTSCVSEELVNNKGEGILRLTIESISGEVSLDSQTKSAAVTPQTQLTAPDASDFTVKIIQSDRVIKEFPYGTEAIVLEAGDYTVEVYTTIHKDPVAFSNELPNYFVGRSNVSIAPGLPKDLAVTAKWGYAAICPKIEEELSNYFKTYSLTVEIEGETTTTVNQDPEDKTLPTFYILSGKNANIYLEGDNHVTSNKKLLLRTFNPVEEATEYNLSVTAHPDAGIFDFGLVAKVDHTKDYNQNLDGTIVNLEMQTSGIPVDLITNWKASLVNSDGLEVRSYAELKNGSATMEVVQDWPYLPHGSYNLKCSYTINGREVNNDNKPIVVSVPAPDFNLTFAPYTSYDKYLRNDIDGANTCDNNKIYNVNGSVNISDKLLSNPNYKASFTYTFDGGEPESLTSNSFSKGDVTVSERKKYTASVDVSFDGVQMSKTSELHITGLPYNPEIMIQEDWDLSYNTSYVDNELQLSGVTGAGSGVATLKKSVISVPTGVNVSIKVISSTFGWPKTTFYVIFDKNNLVEKKGNFENFDFTFSQLWMASSSLQLESSYGAAGPWCRVHKMHILYE